MSDNSSAEKTEEATPRKLIEQREKGQVPRSRELGTFAVTAISVVAVWFTGAATMRQVQVDLREALRFDAADLESTAALPSAMGTLLWQGLGWMLPVLIATVIGGLVGTLMIGGWNFSIKSWAPDWSRLDPLAGFQRMVSWQGLSELLKGLAKFGLLGAILAGMLYARRDDVLALGRLDWPYAPAEGAALLLLTCALLTLGLLVIALIDAPFQQQQYKKRMRMTKHEVREEMKDSEGKPEVKQRIRAQQQAIAQRHIRREMPNATVVITNPRHFAVALRYEQADMDAPVLVAKGSGPEAALIRELAALHGIPQVTAPPLARALYRHVREQQVVPSALYLGVAQVLGYIYQLRRADLNVAPEPPQPEVPTDWQWTPRE